MAIPMPIVQDIRRLDRQGMSRAQIARRLHVDRGTVAKYADMEDCSPKPKADRRYGSKIDPYAHLVDEWLEADRMLPRKQRHTIRRVHDRLLAETDYDGEYSTTMRYVHRWREANRGVPDREGYVRLEWAAGSMQVDFGVARARIAGEMADVHCLCSISCCGFSHDDFSGLGRACRPRNGLNWMVLVSPPERTGKDYDQHAPSTVYPSFAAERGIRRVDRAENTCRRSRRCVSTSRRRICRPCRR